MTLSQGRKKRAKKEQPKPVSNQVDMEAKRSSVKKLPRKKLIEAIQLPSSDLIVLTDMARLKKDALKFNSMQLFAALALEWHRRASQDLAEFAAKHGIKSHLKTVIIAEE